MSGDILDAHFTFLQNHLLEQTSVCERDDFHRFGSSAEKRHTISDVCGKQTRR